MKLLTLILLVSAHASASVFELFGASAGSMAIGNQAEAENASSNVQAAALLGYSRDTKFSFNLLYAATAFKPIDGVVTSNATTSVNALESSDVRVNATPSLFVAAHLSTPLFTPDGIKLNLSLLAPTDRLMEADSGRPYRPQYAMYGSRLQRPALHVSLARALADWSVALGLITGFQSNGETQITTRTTAGNASVGRVSFNAKPATALTASVAHQKGAHRTFLAYRPELRSRLRTRATGETEIASNASFPFDFQVNSLLYYDPLSLQLGHQWSLPQTRLHLGLEFQQWDRYRPATLELRKQGGSINGSENYEQLHPRNIFIPRFGVEHQLSEDWTGKLGYFYRPTPLSPSGLKGAGNTIDVDKHVLALGLARQFRWEGRELVWEIALQEHFLRQYKVVKTPGQEDGVGSDPKIGSPGYRVGGMIHVLSMGLSWNY